MGQAMKMPRFIMFDLDGTLVDTAEEIAHSVNQTLAEAGLEPVAAELVREWIGKGTAWLWARTLEEVTGNSGSQSAALYEQYYPRFLEVYHDLTGHYSVPYPGAQVALSRLRQAGCALAVVTNKDRSLSIRLLDSQGLTQAVDWLVGGGDTAEGKPSPSLCRKPCRSQGLSPRKPCLSEIPVTMWRLHGAPVLRYGLSIMVIITGNPSPTPIRMWCWTVLMICCNVWGWSCRHRRSTKFNYVIH